MATRTSKTSTVRAKAEKTTAPKISRAKKAPAYHEIARRAFELFCAGGYQHGRDVEDWLTAERELAS
jgi:DUF2934 family protein